MLRWVGDDCSAEFGCTQYQERCRIHFLCLRSANGWTALPWVGAESLGWPLRLGQCPEDNNSTEKALGILKERLSPCDHGIRLL